MNILVYKDSFNFEKLVEGVYSKLLKENEEQVLFNVDEIKVLNAFIQISKIPFKKIPKEYDYLKKYYIEDLYKKDIKVFQKEDETLKNEIGIYILAGYDTEINKFNNFLDDCHWGLDYTEEEIQK